MKINECRQKFSEQPFYACLEKLYGNEAGTVALQKDRYEKALERFCALYPDRTNVDIFSASGRTEIGGNHTDHQHGAILAGAVNLDVIAVVAFHNERVVRVHSEGYKPFEINLDNLNPEDKDSGTALIIKGVIFKYAEKGVAVDGFDMYCISDVINGGGISSSASFETLIGTIINNQYNENKSNPFEIAQIGWFAENVFFGKKCGLLDQTVSSFGGLVAIDFKDSESPLIEKMDFDFSKYGYSLCITDTKSNHANLTDDYVAITAEMKQVANFFHCDVLNDVARDAFYQCIPKLRGTCSDRAILRAIHFFDETERAKQEAVALKEQNMERFLALVNASGNSSCELLQNLYSTKNPLHQEIPLAIAISKKILNGRGAVRVHGGGFAGTILAFVPHDLVAEYKNAMDNIFGAGACLELNIRPVGGVKIEL